MAQPTVREVFADVIKGLAAIATFYIAYEYIRQWYIRRVAAILAPIVANEAEDYANRRQ